MLPADNWDNLVKTGKGKSYGVELSLAYKDRYNVIEAGYTLSWSLQKFTDFYPGWYSSKFDNRHKLNIAYRHKFNDRIDAYAAWVYRSGDRATVPNQYVNGPSFPGIPDSRRTGTGLRETEQHHAPGISSARFGCQFPAYYQKGIRAYLERQHL